MTDNVATGRIISYVTIAVPTRGQLGLCPNHPACPARDDELPAVELVAPPDDPNEWWARWPA